MLIRIISLFTILFCLETASAEELTGNIDLKNKGYNDLTVKGTAKFESSSFDSLVVHGDLQFLDIFVKGSVEVHGNMSGKQLECDELYVEGSLNAEALNVEEAEIRGEFSVAKSHFKDLEIAAREAELIDSKVEDITILEIDKDKQTLRLVKSVVEGDITFESEEGKIIMDQGSLIKGEVNGAQVIKE